jgi:hypothetical protein
MDEVSLRIAECQENFPINDHWIDCITYSNAEVDPSHHSFRNRATRHGGDDAEEDSTLDSDA